jgi:hypothetical protein
VVTIGDTGDELGALDAESDGEREDWVGTVAGLVVGVVVGCAGSELGARDKLGALDGDSDGERDDGSVGTVVGLVVGVVVGCAMVCCDGREVGA